MKKPLPRAAAPPPPGLAPGIHEGDCVELLGRVPAGSVPLVFADPPYNVNYRYEDYDDNLDPDAYLEWCNAWLEAVHRVLTPTGSFWLLSGPQFASELDVLAKAIGLHQRKHCIWWFSFGVNTPANFTTSHAHLLYYVRDPARYTFNRDQVRVPAKRQVTGDKRAAPGGRLPDDTWILAAPADDPGLDVWAVPRVCGTHGQRAATPNQVPEEILARVIRLCSDPGDLVLDPFAGSGGTAAVAKKLGREGLGFELSPRAAAAARDRVASAAAGDPIAGVRGGAHVNPRPETNPATQE